ncbi:hypothetical protein F5Y16DRAFT_300368 [Xylariaceae sp. FL0255]|nr:hypothetical protein F5Y16DRAFT_300368 [Xylariaceae sp. FL0255]
MRSSALFSAGAILASSASARCLPTTTPAINGNFTVTWLGSYLNRPYVSFNVSAPENYVEGVHGFLNTCNGINLNSQEQPYTTCYNGTGYHLDASVAYDSSTAEYSVYLRHIQIGTETITVMGSSHYGVSPTVSVPVTSVTVS